MDSKLMQFLQLLVKNKTVKIDDFITQQKLTARQIRYREAKINDFLIENHLPKVTFKNGVYTLKLSEQQKHQLKELIADIDPYDYKMTTEERQEAIALLLIATNDYITSSSFADKLNISKRTADSDISKLKTKLFPLNLELDAKTSKGYRINGNERDIRNLCVNLLMRNIRLESKQYTDFLPLGKIVYEMYCDLYLEKLLEIIHLVEEDEINKELTYESKLMLLMYLVTMIKRMSMGNVIEDYPKTYDNQPQNRNYAIALNIAAQIEDKFSISVPVKEVCMITMYLEGIQYIVPERYLKTDWMQMQILIDEIVQDMSKRMNVDFTSDKELYVALQAHLGHTFFKIQHNIDIANPDLKEIKEKYLTCFNHLKETIKENKSSLLKGITDSEIGYLVLHFCSSLERRIRMLPPAKVAIVCLNGAATARLLRESILTRFSNISIVAVLPKVDFEILRKMELDFIISSIYLGDIDIPYVIVNPLLTEKDYVEINKMLLNYSEQHTTKEDFDLMYSEFLNNETARDVQHLQENLESSLNQFEQPRLKLYQLLTPSYISFYNKAENWREAVKVSCQILLKNNDVNEMFVQSVIQSIQEAGPYVVFSKGVALVHSEVGCGVNRLAISLTRFEDGVIFNHPLFDPVKIVFCLAPNDYSSHVQALQGLLNLLEKYTVDELCSINDSYDLFKMLEREKW